MTGSGDLRARFPGSFRAGGDSPGIIHPTTRDEVAELITRCVVELHPDDVAEFLEEWAGDEWEMLMAVHPEHPELSDLVAWAIGLDDVLLLVAFAAPSPPAVLVLERDRGE